LQQTLRKFNFRKNFNTKSKKYLFKISGKYFFRKWQRLMKLAVLGGGGVRSPFLAKSIALSADKAGIDEVVFMDNNEKKLKIFGAIAKEVSASLNSELKFDTTTDPVYAVKNASVIITTIRVGGDEGRVRDERIALNHGVLGQETTGAGGFAMALRSVPVLLNYCKLIKEHAAEDSLIFNFTNPSGIVTQALRSEGFKNVFGVCDAPSEFLIQVQDLLGVERGKMSFECFGLNHLSWFRNFSIAGINVTEKILSDNRLYTDTEMKVFDPELVKLSGNLLLNEYLYFYYYRERAVNSILASNKTRGETILEINNRMIKDLEKIDIKTEMGQLFKTYMTHYLERENSYFSIESKVKREKKTAPTWNEYINTPDNGGYAGVALQFLEARASGKEIDMVLSVPNDGSIDGLEDEDVVEISCVIGSNGASPKKIGKVPEMQMNLIRQIKLYEKCTVAAIKNRDREMAVKALTVHPLVSSYSLAKKLVDEYLIAHKDYVGEWK
jgi:6-phospho-beta-glucosidase